MTQLQQLSLVDISKKLQYLLDKLEYSVKREYSISIRELREVYDTIEDLKSRSDAILSDITD